LPGEGQGEAGDDEDLLPEGAIDPVEEGEIPGPEGLHPNATWPTASNITLEMATNSCVTPIRSLSIFSVCDEYTAEKMLPLIEGCTLDIQVRWSMLSVGRKQLISFQLWQNWICPADGHFDPFR